MNEEQKKMVIDLDGALDKMPIYKESKPLQRDYFLDRENLEQFIKVMKNNDIFKDKAYLSTSKGHYGEGMEQVHFIINNSKTGRDISMYNPSESEVLFKRNAKFKVTANYLNDGIFTFELEEI